MVADHDTQIVCHGWLDFALTLTSVIWLIVVVHDGAHLLSIIALLVHSFCGHASNLQDIP